MVLYIVVVMYENHSVSTTLRKKPVKPLVYCWHVTGMTACLTLHRTLCRYNVIDYEEHEYRSSTEHRSRLFACDCWLLNSWGGWKFTRSTWCDRGCIAANSSEDRRLHNTVCTNILCNVLNDTCTRLITCTRTW